MTDIDIFRILKYLYNIYIVGKAENRKWSVGRN